MRKDGFKVSKQALSQILHNTVYCGLLPDKYDRNNGDYIKGIHEPLISEEQFFRVQNILDGKNRTGVKRLRNNPLYPLRGYMYCWVCGNKMTASASRAKGGDLFYYYHCTRPHCNGSRVQKKILEKEFADFLQRIKPSDEILNLFEKCVIAKFKEKTKAAEQRRKQIKIKITDLETQKSRVINLLAKGTIDDEDGKIEIAKIKEQINQQQGILAEMASQPNVEECWLFAKNMLLNIDKAWVSGDLEFKQQLQGLIMPAGFKFDGKLIKPIKNPYFLSIFQQKTGENMNKGG
jgi:uncharacterized protein YlaI